MEKKQKYSYKKFIDYLDSTKEEFVNPLENIKYRIKNINDTNLYCYKTAVKENKKKKKKEKK